jgi:hypothetical protein
LGFLACEEFEKGDFPMLQTVLALSLTCFLTLTGCAGGSLDTQSLSNQSARDIPSDTVMTLERSSCFGPCPVYKLAIYAGGKVVFEGKENVKKTGKIEGRITRAQVRELLSAFEQLGYFNLKERYSEKDCPEMWTDFPSAKTSLTSNGRSKTVNHYHGCRGLEILEKLTKLEARIDEAVNVDQWVK